MKNKKKSTRKKEKSLINLFAGILVIFLINLIGSHFYERIDLTAEKRYTLSSSTLEMLKSLDDIVFFKIYLEGDFPAGFKRLRNETRELLRQFNAYNKNIQFEFIDPTTIGANVNAVYEELIRKGLNPTDLHVRNESGSSQKIIFPGAIVTYQGKELPLHLLTSQLNTAPEEALNNSIQSLEYNISSSIRRLVAIEKPSIAFLEGHGELDKMETWDIAQALSEYYQVDRITLNEKVGSITERRASDSSGVVIKNKYKALIIARPDTLFSEKDKFILDQYLMRGGKILWFIDPVLTGMDSLTNSGSTIGLETRLNLDDLFFRYGVRPEKKLVLDLSCLPIPITTGNIGGKPQVDFLSWYYFPVLTPQSNHPIVKNLNLVRTEFVSPLDTITVQGVKPSVLLQSSSYSRIVNTPAYINLEMLREEPDPRFFNHPPVAVAVLLEGIFPSLYTNRLTPEILDSELIDFKEQSIPTAMIVAGDGDLPKNQFRSSDGMPLPAGYDQYTQQSFGNKDFILNAVNYLCDDSGLIHVRSRDIKLRLLDQAKIKSNKTIIQILNVLIPVMLILIPGFIKIIIRRKKYSRKIIV
ncbi:MAG: gliding motility-associated ABC transporter substrate-binding protein GldG [Bacteroidales bacterium]|nr:gliding motility-associated ABC transporter substrate-binding protein GldG [Bacteroidales bacterium]MDD2324024.1 gliding motility-associated ABC transporter substrate-binding protein GldG [Bacteroidales bacterium]MDD3011158.1 gliding motility-associated ABC transporter substrate-binding protein GldG [Bacteroidales bacterium]MDD3961586.1 gliding motility-associated ABC transporter substrate-binding protein GldG [Bacteroidales bacterium]MDY0285575.1 gliding motility-associated ABC transporter 